MSEEEHGIDVQEQLQQQQQMHQVTMAPVDATVAALAAVAGAGSGAPIITQATDGDTTITVVPNGGKGGIRKGRFLVTTDEEPDGYDDQQQQVNGRDDAVSVGGSSVPGNQSVTTRKTGRFLVVTEVDEDDADNFTVDEQASTSDILRLSMSSIGSLTSMVDEPMSRNLQSSPYQADYLQYQPQQLAQSAPPAPVQRQPQQQQVPVQTQQIQQQQQQQQQHHQQQQMPPMPSGQGGSKPGAGGTHHRKATPTTIMFELQKISAQNRKLHKMLLEMTNDKQGIVPNERPGSSSSTTSSVPEQGEDIGSPIDGPEGGAGGGGTSSRPSSSKQVPVPANTTTAKLQSLVNELSSTSRNVVIEYDELKMRNFMLTKQLKDAKTQLKEANLLIENLKDELSKAQKKAASA